MKTVADVQSFITADARASRNVQLHHAYLHGLADKPDPATVANELVERWGFTAINRRSWSIVDEASAADIARRLLSMDLAYKSELIPEKTAIYLATCLVGALSKWRCRFLCNAEFRGASMSWDAIGSSTFEVALLGFDEAQAFLLYADAED
jgi:hypothetical protein